MCCMDVDVDVDVDVGVGVSVCVCGCVDVGVGVGVRSGMWGMCIIQGLRGLRVTKILFIKLQNIQTNITTHLPDCFVYFDR
jgi:hypothetical protein